MHSIETVVHDILKSGYLPPSMEAQINQAYESEDALSLQEYLALDRLMSAIVAGEVLVVPRKQFINVMEELVLMETGTRLKEVEAHQGPKLDLGDIAAYALNRLPPLYATSKEGATFQRIHAQEELKSLIAQQVAEAINRSIANPDFFPERQAIQRRSWNNEDAVLEQITSLLRSHAPGLQEQAGFYAA